MSNKPTEHDLIAWLEGTLDPARYQFVAAALDEDAGLREELRQIEVLQAELTETEEACVDEGELDLARAGLSALLARHPRHPANFDTASPDLKAIPDTRPAQPVPQPRVRPVRRWRLAAYAVSTAACTVIAMMMVLNKHPLNTTAEAPVPFGGGELTAASLNSQAVGSPSSRQYAVQDLEVESGSGVRILLDETSRYEINGSAADDEIQEYLGYIVRNDRDSDRRLKAIRILEDGAFTPNTLNVLVYALSHDPSQDVRYAAAGALAPSIDLPVVRQAFLKALVDDPTPELRGLAGRVLSAGGGSASPLGGGTR